MTPSVAVLFARKDSIYKTMPQCDVWDEERDARLWPGGLPLVVHPPCAQWGRLKFFARKDDALKALAPLAVGLVREWGGVLEHPVGSSLWRDMPLPEPGSRDAFGGFTMPLNQNWFGHRARKPTLLYIVGIEPRDLPDIPFSIAPPTATIETEIRGRPGALPAVTRAEREATPRAFAEWLVALAQKTKARELCI